jgi:phosphoglycerol geranylgeranyltransferase
MAARLERRSVLTRLLDAIAAKGAIYMVLLDPDGLEPSANVDLARRASEAGADALLVGGSLSLRGLCHDTVVAIKGATDLPVIIFPGDAGFVTPAADAVLFLSLISGRNPQYLIGEQVRAAPVVRESGIEPIPVGYMLVDGGTTTSVEFMSGTKPLPRDKPDIAMAHALAAQYMGMQIAFFDAGSGGLNHVPSELVSRVASYVDIPIMVGGGIRDPEAAATLVDAGASIIVTGDVLEKGADAGLLSAFAQAIHHGREPDA